MGKMLISSASCENLKQKLRSRDDIYCTGLYLSARWMVLSQAVSKGVQFIILPDKDNAEYCAADLYNLLDGDVVFYLPPRERG